MNNFFANIHTGIKYAPIIIWQVFTLAVFLLIIILLKSLVVVLRRLPFFGGLAINLEASMTSRLKKISRYIIRGKSDSIDQIDLISLSLGNMRMRKTRTLVTIGGMTVGISIIVFLVSLGYGLQEMVISRVAKLEQMRQADISLQTGSKLKIDDTTMGKLSELPNVASVSPIVSVVGKVSFNNSISDVVAYGVTSDYLKASDIKITQGVFYDNNQVINDHNSVEQDFSTDDVQRDGEITFTIDDNEWIRVRENSNRDAKVLGYTRQSSKIQTGKQAVGGQYVDGDGKVQTAWIVASLPLWNKKVCTSVDTCKDGEYAPMIGTNGQQLSMEGYVAEVKMTILKKFDINQQRQDLLNKNVLGQHTKRQAVINKAMLAILGMNEQEAVGKQFETSFVVVENLMGEDREKLESPKMQYEIVGIVNEGSMPIFYVPFIDLRSLGIVNYSQLKVVANSQQNLPAVRKQIEAMGFEAYSVSDTVDQINSFFATARLILGLVGMVALLVASLGMFNTLTVSLLERTREVGLLKAMGMGSTEVRNLFLTESIIMGFVGGIAGVFLGFLLGKMLSAVVSIFSVASGLGAVNIAYIPWELTFFVASISLAVGLLTGIYPAMRAQKISALNALRYE